jgi:hypothetical protein
MVLGEAGQVRSGLQTSKCLALKPKRPPFMFRSRPFLRKKEKPFGAIPQISYSWQFGQHDTISGVWRTGEENSPDISLMSTIVFLEKVSRISNQSDIDPKGTKSSVYTTHSG